MLIRSQLMALWQLEAAQKADFVIVDKIQVVGELATITGPKFAIGLPNTATAQELHLLLGQYMELKAPSPASTGDYPIEQGTAVRWRELHHDLGMLESCLGDFGNDLRYDEITLDGSTASVWVASDIRRICGRINLAEGEPVRDAALQLSKGFADLPLVSLLT